MSRIIADFIGFGKTYMRNVSGPFFAFVFPILLILVFGAIFSGDNLSSVGLPVQNLDDGPYSEVYIEVLNMTGIVEIETIPEDASIHEYIDDNSLPLALVIPEDFSESIIASLSDNDTGLATVTVYGDPTRSTYNMAVGAVDAAVQYLNNNLTGLDPIVSFEVSQGGAEEFNYMDFFLPGVVGITVMTNSLFAMTSICAEYRSRGYFRLLATTKISKAEWLVSKFLFFTILLIASLMITYAIGQAMFEMETSLTLVSFVLIAMGVFLFVSMGMLLGVIIKDPESGAAVANAIGFPMMFLSGAFFPLDSMPEYLQLIAKAIPLSYLNEGLRDSMVYSNNESALLNLAVLAVIAVVIFVAASRFMSWRER
ncbi:MAG: ABC transporter permease [Methanobacteriota archaeon]|nr:MAG: ABC transporter permease [Euryarchaeota archaeon]